MPRSPVRARGSATLLGAPPRTSRVRREHDHADVPRRARARAEDGRPVDEIIVTELDHHANIAPWHALAQERGVTVRTARMIPGDG